VRALALKLRDISSTIPIGFMGFSGISVLACL
jgi:hypothetical protein